MQLNVQNVADGVDLVQVAGRLDYSAVQEIDPALAKLASTGAPRMILDMSDVSFLASIGIRSLLTSARALRSRGGSLALLRPTPMVAQVLQVTGIQAMIPVFDDLDAATAAVQAKRG
jgi:anti-anti-sigma factor